MRGTIAQGLSIRRSRVAEMKEVYQVISTGVGAILGLVAGLGVFMAIFPMVGQTVGKGGMASVVAAIGLCGGGMVLGGYVALAIRMRIDKARRKKKAAEKKARRKKR